MKQIYTATFFVFSFLLAHSQDYNLSFEQWDSVQHHIEPRMWGTFNGLSEFGLIPGAERTTDAVDEKEDPVGKALQVVAANIGKADRAAQWLPGNLAEASLKRIKKLAAQPRSLALVPLGRISRVRFKQREFDERAHRRDSAVTA